MTCGGTDFSARREGAFKSSSLLEAPGGAVAARAVRRFGLTEEDRARLRQVLQDLAGAVQ
jgi:hypothetical protein